MSPISRAVSTPYREHHGQAGGMSNPDYAAILANILLTEQHLQRGDQRTASGGALTVVQNASHAASSSANVA